VKFDFIAAENALRQFSIQFMCRMLEVTPSGYYAYLKRGICSRKQKDLELVALVHAELKKYGRGCGSRRGIGPGQGRSSKGAMPGWRR